MFCAFLNHRRWSWSARILMMVIGATTGAGFVRGQPGGTTGAKPVDLRLTPVAAGTPTRITIADPRSAFARLTAHAFGDSAKTLIQFNADGTYRHKVTTHPPPMGCPVGLPNFDRHGTWTMRWNKDHGMVQLETGDMLAIAFADKSMFFGQLWLPQRDRLGNQPQDLPIHPAKSYAELSTFKPNALHAKLGGARWRKSDRFNLFMYPTQVQFDPLGRFSAQFREGACKMEGFWSLTGQGTQLLTVGEENQSDLRGPGTGSIGASPENPEFEDELMLFYGTSYRPESSKADDQVFAFDAYSNSVRVTGRLTKPLKKGVAAELELTFKAKNGDYELEEIAFSQAVYKFNGKGYSLASEIQSLARLKLGCRLDQGKTITRNVAIMPVYAGADVSLDFDFRYRDARQEYRGRRGFFGPVEP